MGIEFNGDIKFNKSDVISNLKKKDDATNSNPTLIGDLLGSKVDKNAFTIGKEITIDEDFIEKLVDAGLATKFERTPEQQKALEELNEKVSSTGISYGEATAKIDEIRVKYNDDKYFKEVTIRDNQPKNSDRYIDIVRFPIKHKVFDESKLPEPARTEYREAMAAKEEIENNNTALAKKAGINPSGHDKPPVAGREISEGLADVLKRAGGIKAEEPTEKQKAARAKLDEKQSSTGVKYKDAKAVINQLTEKYKDSCRSEFESQQPTNGILIYIMPYEAFDPYKIPEPDRTAYFDALAAVTEIEQQNSALLQQGGLSMTPQPNRNYAGMWGRKLD